MKNLVGAYKKADFEVLVELEKAGLMLAKSNRCQP